MEKICLDAETKGFTSTDIKELGELNLWIHDNFIKYYTMQEDILFPELEKVLPSPTSTNSMRNEHREILKLNDKLNTLLNISGESNNERIQSTTFSLTDIIQRHIHKKNNVMYHEVSSFLSEATQGEIYKKILKKVS